MSARRYCPLCGPYLSCCEELWPSAEAFFDLKKHTQKFGKKSEYFFYKSKNRRNRVFITFSI